MKPIIIYVDGNRDEIRLNRKQFEKFIQDAYQQGYDNGYADGNKRYYWGPYVYTTTATNQSPSITYTTGTDPNTYKPSVTCDTTNEKTFAPGGTITGSNLFIHGDDAVEKIINNTANTIGGEVHNSIGD